MISSKNGRVVIDAKGSEVLADLSCICAAVRKVFKEAGMEDKHIRELLNESVEDAFRTDEELEGEVEKVLTKLIKKAMRNKEDKDGRD